MAAAATGKHTRGARAAAWWSVHACDALPLPAAVARYARSSARVKKLSQARHFQTEGLPRPHLSRCHLSHCRAIHCGWRHKQSRPPRAAPVAAARRTRPSRAAGSRRRRTPPPVSSVLHVTARNALRTRLERDLVTYAWCEEAYTSASPRSVKPVGLPHEQPNSQTPSHPEPKLRSACSRRAAVCLPV